jgi:hypothetical protein
VLEEAVHVAVVVDVVPLEQDVARDDRVVGEGEEPVAVVVEIAVADGDVLAELEVDRGRGVRVALGGAIRTGEAEGRPRVSYISRFSMTRYFGITVIPSAKGTVDPPILITPRTRL